MKNKVISMFGNKNIIQNEGAKYSKLLEQFIEPFVKEFEDVGDVRDVEDVEDIFEFAINAWNLGNMEVIISNDTFEKNISQFQNADGDVNLSLLKKLVDNKAKNFKEHTNFIVDFEFKETKKGPVISVITQEEKAYLTNMIEAHDEFEDDEFDEDDEFEFEENYINRCAIIIKPQQPFLDWYSELNLENGLDVDIIEINTYLVNDGIHDIEKWLKKKFDKLFKLQLEEWFVEQKDWPKKRTYKMFKHWFRVEISEMIFDLEKKPVSKSE